uniref:Ficolin-like protein-2 of n=1 Tax=Sinonovacula constricta TaxID=98310 RepID=A0A8K1YI14_SINCO|nr:ficolin-like protein-2 of [Sinonovacula constricta]
MTFHPWKSIIAPVMVILLCGVVTSEKFVCEKVLPSGGDPVVSSDVGLAERVMQLERRVNDIIKFVNTLNVSDHAKLSFSGGYPRDCHEIYESGVQNDGMYNISPDGRCPFSAFCDMRRGGWTVIQRRVDGSVNFYRPWDEYVQGFGPVDGEHWLGLEKIHRLTKDGSQIFFMLQRHNGTMETARYRSFVVHGYTTAYRMNVDSFGYRGTLPELFSAHDNMKFSTFDRDNDMYSGNCCEEFAGGGGWWFNNCYRLGNLNSVYAKQGGGGIGFFDTQHVPIRNVVISVKPPTDIC